MDCWRSAFSNKDIQEGIESGKICTDLVWNPAKRQAYGENIYEVTTVADVDRLVGNPDAIYMQSLIIRDVKLLANVFNTPSKLNLYLFFCT